MQTNTSHSCLRPFGWCVVLLLISTQGWGQECISGNCINGQSTITYDGGKYVGEFRDDKRHGHGTHTLPPPWGNVEAGIWEKDNFIETFEDKSRRERIYNACILDESDGVDMSVRSLEMTVRETCTEISKNPSWLDGFRYD